MYKSKTKKSIIKATVCDMYYFNKHNIYYNEQTHQHLHAVSYNIVYFLENDIIQ